MQLWGHFPYTPPHSGFRKEAESAIRALSDGGGGAAAAARLAERHPASPLALHVLGHALAFALLYARRPGEALAECARALAVPDPTDPALHAAAAAASRRGLTVPSPQARVAAARERLLGVRADAEALEATGVRRAAAAPLQQPVMAPTKMSCCCHHATKRSAVTDDDLHGFLTVSFDDLTAHCDQPGSVHLLTRAVEFAKVTKALAYWLCPVCDKVFLDADELQELQPLMPKRAALDADELQFSLKWTPFELGEEDLERRRNLDKVKEVFSCLNTFKALPVGLMDKVIKGWEFVRTLGNEGKSKGRSEIISLVQDGSLVLSLDAEKIVTRKKDGTCEEDALFRWLLNSLEEVAMPWASLRQKCVHHGNEVLERIYEISDSLLRQSNLKCAGTEKNHRGYSLTEADSIDVEMLLLDNEVGYLKNKLVEVCTFDYSAAILPLIRAYIWDKLNNSPGGDSRDGVDKGAVDNGDGFDNLHGESLFEDKIPDTDSDVQFTISRTDECENSSLSQSDSSNFSTVETESFSIDSGVATVLHITADDLQILNVTLRMFLHLKGYPNINAGIVASEEFHDRFLNMPLVLPHFTVELHCIVCLLRKIFNAWDNEKDYGVTTFPSDVRTAFSDILNDWNLFGKEAHNVFGLPISREQKKCNCLNESSKEKDYTTFFHSVDVSAIQTMEMKSFGQLLRDADKQNQYAVLRRNISALPGKRENGSCMEARQQRHEFSIIFYFFVLPCNAHDLCLYLQFADSWESLLRRYRHRSLRPQILFFDCVRYSSIR
ncbi:hypothetical protein C2845_PM17G12770 [Panicum miliaceum]|uniref:DUF629 domain-containing protein n=1 Tax=Panicum miliaceum TaxID=4540 RepID=A0A3L6Q030_PANMI|nr:hypothetical protein C2845_PM17G12770 [Panicum miliaceum]